MNRIVIAVLLALLLNTRTIFAAGAFTGTFQNYCGQNVGIVAITTPWYCSQIDTVMQSYWVKWAPVAYLAIFASFSIATMIFIAGILFRSERLRNFGIGEYYEAVATAMIVLSFLFISAILMGLVPATVTGYIDPYNTSLTYINSTINVTKASVFELFRLAVINSYYTTISLTYCSDPGHICSSTPNFFAYTIRWLFYIPAFTLIDLQLEAIMVLYGEFYLILMLMYIAIPVFLIPGVLLRSILPTRSVGGLMIAVAIGFYVVMPILFSVAYYFTHLSLLAQLSQTTAALTKYGTGTGAQLNSLSPSAPLVETLQNINQSIGSYWLSILFYPSLIIALTYAIIQQLAEFLGGMAQAFSGRMRL